MQTTQMILALGCEKLAWWAFAKQNHPGFYFAAAFPGEDTFQKMKSIDLGQAKKWGKSA